VRNVSKFIALGLLACLLILAIIVLAMIFGKTDRTVEATGMIVPVEEFEICPEIDGLIERVLVEEGEAVAEGDTLIRIDCEDLDFRHQQARREVSEAEADLAEIKAEYRNLTTSESFEISAVLADIVAAEKRMEKARLNFERTEELYEKDLVSLDQKEDAELTYDLAKSNYRVLKQRRDVLESRYQRLIEEKKQQVRLLRRACDLAARQLARAVLTAPQSGVIMTRHPERLEGTRAVRGEPLLRIGDMSDLKFSAMVSENGIPEVHRGQDVEIFINAYPHREYKVFRGHVIDIAGIPVSASTGVAFEITADIDEPWVENDSIRVPLMPGMTGRAEIVVESEVRLIEKLLDVIGR